MRKSALSLQHGPQMIARLDSIGMHLSEFSFANLYLFRKTHQYEYVEAPSGNIYISGLSYDKKHFLMPMVSPEKSGKICYEELKNFLAEGKWDFLFPIAEEWLECFDEQEYEWEFSPDDSDYLFFTDKFKRYAGKKMHKKKNLLNQFLKNHESVLVPITDDVLDDAREILEIWQRTTPQEMATSDYHQCMESLDCLHDFHLTSAIVFADDKPAGFIIGEPLNDETFTIHFAKADISFKGVYQFLFSRFAADFCPDYRYMNLEQDMGNAGLRKTKISYRPDLMAHKYRISLKVPEKL